MIGKQYLNLTVTMWKQDIEDGLLMKFELLEDPLLSDVKIKPWLMEVLSKIIQGNNALLTFKK